MKVLSFIILLGIFQACDPYGFGFKMNPAFVINEAFESVQALDHEALLKVTGKEALCLYANHNGVAYLRGNLNIDNEKVEIFPKLVENSSKYTRYPHYVGYWSYYQERYLVDILDKTNKSNILNVLVECHYGFEGEKRDEYQNLKLKKYKKKECRIIKMLPSKFASLPMRDACIPLKVEL